MSRLSNITPEYESLLAAACREDVAPEELHALERMADDPDSMRLLADYLQLNTDLQWLIRRQSNADKCLAMLGIEPLHDSLSVSGFDDGEAADPPLVIPALSPPPPLSTIHNPLSADFVGGPVFSYMVASVILCMMLLGGWVYKVSHVGNMPGDMANNPPSKQQYTPVFIGQITGMRDCRWGKDEPGTIVGASVPLGRKYSLESGLLQITYKTGANVVLEGPCEYIADSRDGGFLRVGKLVARVNKRVASGQWLVARNKGRGPAASATSAKPQAANPQPPTTSLSTLHSPLFTISTPTAIVTDLGTEFGVEVDHSGNTTSHVFHGTVRVETGNEQSVVLLENESVRVEKTGRVRETHHASGEKAEPVRFTNPTTPPKFVRRLREPPKLLDLLDIVAGGSGMGNRRERGIDPVSGLEDPTFVPHYRTDDRQYRLVFWHRLIDGVFVPDGRGGDVQIDSSGNKFSGFPATSGEAFGSIWSRAAEIGSKRVNTAQPWVYSIIDEKKFMPKSRGLLGIYANGGITFDLEAVGKMYAEAVPSRFRATAGLADGPRKDPDASGMADVWVFVDGRLKLKREKIQVRDGMFPIDMELKSGDRFLTLAVTDGGNGISWDGVVFGDPVLEMASDDNLAPQLKGGKEDKRK